MKKIILSPEARVDLASCCDYIGENNPDAAMNFFDAARATFADIARMPSIGQAYKTNNPKLQFLRKWQVKKFRDYLIFYCIQPDSIEIVRILHGSQDVDLILSRA